MHEMKPLNVNRYLSHTEIEKHLENVDYIIMASPSMMNPPEHPIHFMIVLNTSEPLPPEIQPLVFEKFCRDLNINATSHLLSNLERISFAVTTQETPMPRHIVDDAEASTTPWKLLYILDFLGDSPDFKEAKEGFSGWSYSYN